MTRPESRSLAAVRVDKAFAYITQSGRLLVFEHVDHPEAGVQVPAGTVRPGEAPRDAAIREAREETGLAAFAAADLLGIAMFDARPHGKDQLHRRHVFHLPLAPSSSSPERWRHFERDASEGGGEAIAFELYWLGLAEAAVRLDHGHGVLLGALAERVCPDRCLFETRWGNDTAGQGHRP